MNLLQDGIRVRGPWIHAKLGTLLLGAALAVTGCGGYGGFCDEYIACNGGNDADYEACELSLEHDEEVASIYGCDAEWDDYYLCLEERSDCDNDVYGPDGDDCADEGNDWGRCVD